MKLKLLNQYNEKLDVLVEGNQDAGKSIIFVHGFGSNKNEGFNLFVDVSKALKKDFRIIRFDFSGFGQSEGKQEDVNYKKQTKDLKIVLNYVKQKFSGPIYIYAHSMGSFVTALFSPDDIEKIIFTSPPSTAIVTYQMWQERIKAKGGKVNLKGITIYPRTSGAVQTLGPSFWRVLKNFKEHQTIATLADKTQLIVFKPLQDEVTGNDNYGHYKKIPNLQYIELNGDHNFTKAKNRNKLIKYIKKLLT